MFTSPFEKTSEIQQRGDGSIEGGHVERLAVIRTCPGPDETRAFAWVGIMGEDDDRSLAGEHAGTEVLHQVRPVDVGLMAVEDDKSRSTLPRHLEASPPVVSNDQSQALPATGDPGEDDASIDVPADIQEIAVPTDLRSGMPSTAAGRRVSRRWDVVDEAETGACISGRVRLHVS